MNPPRAVAVRFVLLGWIVAASPAHADEEGTLLAEIPPDVEVTTDTVSKTNLGTGVVRSSVVWSSDGTRVAYAARRGVSWIPFVGNTPGDEFDFVSRPVLRGGHAFFLVGRILDESRQSLAIWIDGESLEPEDLITGFAVDPSGTQVAYWTQPGARYGNVEASKSWDLFLTLASEKREGKWSVSRPRDEYRGEPLEPILFTADGRRVVSPAMRKGGGWVVAERHGKRVKERTDKLGRIANVAISPDGKALAYAVQSTPDEPCDVYFRKKLVGRAQADVPLLAVGPSGKQVAYAVATEEGASVCVGSDEAAKPSWDHVVELAFGPQGTRVAFVANDGGVRSADADKMVVGGFAHVVVRPTVTPENVARGAPVPRGPRPRLERGWRASGLHRTLGRRLVRGLGRLSVGAGRRGGAAIVRRGRTETHLRGAARSRALVAPRSHSTDRPRKDTHQGFPSRPVRTTIPAGSPGGLPGSGSPYLAEGSRVNEAGRTGWIGTRRNAPAARLDGSRPRGRDALEGVRTRTGSAARLDGTDVPWIPGPWSWKTPTRS